MVYGKTDRERISLNHDTLWAGKPGQTMVKGAYKSYAHAQKLALAGNCADAQEELEQNFTGPWHNPYLLLGTLWIKRIGSEEMPEAYLRTLNLEQSLLSVHYREDGIVFDREYFISYAV